MQIDWVKPSGMGWWEHVTSTAWGMWVTFACGAFDHRPYEAWMTQMLNDMALSEGHVRRVVADCRRCGAVRGHDLEWRNL